MSSEENKSQREAESAPVDRVVMPSLYDLRTHARSMLEASDEIELAKSLQDGDRIGSYQCYVDWLRAGRNGELYVSQAIETMLFDLFDKNDKEEIARVIKKATQYMLRL